MIPENEALPPAHHPTDQALSSHIVATFGDGEMPFSTDLFALYGRRDRGVGRFSRPLARPKTHREMPSVGAVWAGSGAEKAEVTGCFFIDRNRQSIDFQPITQLFYQKIPSSRPLVAARALVACAIHPARKKPSPVCRSNQRWNGPAALNP